MLTPSFAAADPMLLKKFLEYLQEHSNRKDELLPYSFFSNFFISCGESIYLLLEVADSFTKNDSYPKTISCCNISNDYNDIISRCPIHYNLKDIIQYYDSCLNQVIFISFSNHFCIISYCKGIFILEKLLTISSDYPNKQNRLYIVEKDILPNFEFAINFSCAHKILVKKGSTDVHIKGNSELSLVVKDSVPQEVYILLSRALSDFLFTLNVIDINDIHEKIKELLGKDLSALVSKIDYSFCTSESVDIKVGFNATSSDCSSYISIK